MISKKVIILLSALLLISPIFGIYLADLIGYHEPLDIAAEVLGLSEEEYSWTPLKDYTFPGLPDWLGYIVSGVLGVLVIIAAGFIINYFTVVRK